MIRGLGYEILAFNVSIQHRIEPITHIRLVPRDLIGERYPSPTVSARPFFRIQERKETREKKQLATRPSVCLLHLVQESGVLRPKRLIGAEQPPQLHSEQDSICWSFYSNCPRW